MQRGRQILSPQRFQITLRRLASQIIENYSDQEEILIIGIQEKGVVLAERIIEILKKQLPNKTLKLGKLDITFYRDDFRLRNTPIKASTNQIDFSIEAQKVLLVDDVLYTGRTIHAAISALQDFGRVETLELMCMVDRRFNRHLPIRADYVGIEVDSLDDAYVRVQWEHIEGRDKVLIFSSNKEDKE